MEQPELDPTRLRDQPSLVSSRGTIWLVIAGLLAAIAIAIMVPLRNFAPSGLAVVGVVLIAVLYAAMVAVRFLVRAGRLRLGLLASLTLGIAAAALVCIGVVAATQQASA